MARFIVGLGLDLSGGTAVTLTAQAPAAAPEPACSGTAAPRAAS
jgi:preprotein translocase subunit SecD